jgi:KipI family sensor histidine kinase inhibitor
MMVRPLGERAVLVEHAVPLALAAAVRGAGWASDVVPGWATVAVHADLPANEIAARLDTLDVPNHVAPGQLVDITVRYDGPDLDAVATLTGLTVDEVVTAHTAPTYTVAFCGFRAGFPYLSGLDSRLATVPRLATPRVRVPGGSVAIAAGQAGVYPEAAPGGWRILGTTDAVLFDARCNPPNLVAPGDQVRFLRARG